MKKLAVIVLVFVMISLSVNAQKTNRVFTELTKTMLVSRPAETIKHENVVVSYWKIENGGFYYLTEKQEFIGKYKSYNFISTSKKTTILGLNRKGKTRKVKKDLLLCIKLSQFE